MSDKVRVGFIGCGGIAGYHFGHFEKMGEAQIVAVCDLIEEKAQKAAQQFSATPYLSYADMLASEELDAVYVCVEPCAHDGMELLAIEKGCHLFVEKPMALSMEYANTVKDALADKGLISGVGFQTRYVETIPRVKAWLEMQDIGIFCAYRLGGMPRVWWWRRRDTSGGQVVEQSIHGFDMCRYLFGEVVAVQAMGRRGIMGEVEDYDTEDASSVTMTFESGVVGTLLSGCFSQFGGKGGIDVYAKTGHLQFRAGSGFTIREANMTIEGKSSNDIGQDEDEAFIEAVQTGDQSLVLSSYADACKSLEVTLAANESMDAGGTLVRLT